MKAALSSTLTVPSAFKMPTMSEPIDLMRGAASDALERLHGVAWHENAGETSGTAALRAATLARI